MGLSLRSNTLGVLRRVGTGETRQKVRTVEGTGGAGEKFTKSNAGR